MLNTFSGEATFGMYKDEKVEITARRRGAGYDMIIIVPHNNLYRRFNLTIDSSPFVDYVVSDKDNELNYGTVKDINSVVKEHLSGQSFAAEKADYIANTVSLYQELSKAN